MIYIEAVDIQDAWFQTISNLIDKGRKYIIDQGSFVGQTRLEADYLVVNIKEAYKEPYDLMLPQIPSHLNIPNPVSEGYVEQYIPYLMTDVISPMEQYTYGSRIYSQLERMINLLKMSPGTNQAILQVAKPDDCLLPDPPCLRHIGLKINCGFLNFFPYFRSWDLWGGMPANLAGIAVLQKFMADEIGVEVGRMVAATHGGHIYDYVEEIAKLRVNKSFINLGK